MKYKFNQIFIITILSISILYFFAYQSQQSDNSNYAQQKLLLNEIVQLTNADPSNQAIQQLNASLQKQTNKEALFYLGCSYLILLFFFFLLYMYLYTRIIHPFKKMELFASEVANGNLDIPLQESKGRFFGSFNWAFDHMRYELKRSKENEQIAIANTKTMIATISHDIKTPIASISAYSEALKANLDTTMEKRERYLQVILHKCKEITQLTNDLFLHSLSDMDELTFNLTKVNSKQFIEEVRNDWLLQYANRIEISSTLPSCTIVLDKQRFLQAMDNIISNAMKYTDKSVVLTFKQVKDSFTISIKDQGHGILAEDLPFIMNKFYRGKNTENKPGAGLGLFIVQDIMHKMNGTLQLCNSTSGLEVILSLKIS